MGIVEQSVQIREAVDEAAALQGDAASRRVSRGIMKALEMNRLAPGQRLVETGLAVEYGVGRNAVREALQWLAAHGIIDITRHRSAALRRLDAPETLEVLEVAESVLGLLMKSAARHFSAPAHQKRLAAALSEIERAGDEAGFARARRHFYGTLLQISHNRALQRLFPAIGLHILFAQYRAAAPNYAGRDEFRAIATAVTNGDAEHAQALGRAHIGRIRQSILRDGGR